jgi:hypothetical protein
VLKNLNYENYESFEISLNCDISDSTNGWLLKRSLATGSDTFRRCSHYRQSGSQRTSLQPEYYRVKEGWTFNSDMLFLDHLRQNKIMLSEGEYAVLDKNATDGAGAFQLPNPDPDNDGVTVYSVWARALGKPGGKATMQTAAWDVGLDGVLGTADDILVYSMYKLEVERGHGKQVFSDVSRYLLYVYVEEDIIGDPDEIPDSGDEVVLVEAGRYPLFDPALEDYFWEYDNHGLKLLQLRFYEVSVEVPDWPEE